MGVKITPTAALTPASASGAKARHVEKWFTKRRPHEWARRSHSIGGQKVMLSGANSTFIPCFKNRKILSCLLMDRKKELPAALGAKFDIDDRMS